MNASAINVRNLTVAYRERPVLTDVDICIPEGTLLGIVGPNGAGKTTLIKSILGLINPLAANISILGKPLTQQRHHIAYVPQRTTVDWDFPINVLDVVLMGSYRTLGWFSRPGKVEKERALTVLEKVGMTGYASRQIGQLSGGQQQRVFLARALMQEPSIYLLDEPFAGVDMSTEKIIINLLKELSTLGKTILVVHHDLQKLHEYFAWLLLLNVHKVACGPLAEVFTPENINATYAFNPAQSTIKIV